VSSYANFTTTPFKLMPLNFCQNRIFIDPFIVRTAASIYGGKLSNEKAKIISTAKSSLIFNGSVSRMIDGIIECLQQSNIPGRMECVWSSNSFYLNGGPNELSTTIHHAFCQAVSECTRFLSEKGLFSTDDRWTIDTQCFKRQKKGWIQILWKTICKVINGVQAVQAVEGGVVNILPEQVLYTRDFANAYVSEAFLCRIFRGTFGKFPNFLEQFVCEQDNENPIPDLPFNQHFSLVNGMLQADIDISRLYRDFNTILLGNYPDIFGNFIKCFSAWKSLPRNGNQQAHSNAIKPMITSLVDLILACFRRCLPGVNTSSSPLSALWHSNTRTHAKRVRKSMELYTILTKPERGINCAIAPLAVILENVRAAMHHRIRGGLVHYISMEIERMMIPEQIPLTVIYNPFSVIYIVPSGSDDNSVASVVKIYKKVFKKIYGVTTGRRNISVERFLDPLVRALNEEEPEVVKKIDIQTIFDFIRNLLDEIKSYSDPGFRRQLVSVRNALLNPNAAEEFIAPFHRINSISMERLHSPTASNNSSRSNQENIFSIHASVVNENIPTPIRRHRTGRFRLPQLTAVRSTNERLVNKSIEIPAEEEATASGHSAEWNPISVDPPPNEVILLYPTTQQGYW
jgi:hypothetical protein